MRPIRTALLLLTALTAATWLVVGVAGPASSKLTNGFAAYYTAGQLLREGQPAARFYDDDWFRGQTIRLGFNRAQDIYNVNPPAAALLLWPLATLDPVVAKQVLTAFNLICLALAPLCLAVILPRGRRLRGLAVTLILIGLFEPVAEEVRLGQAYALLLLAEVAFFAAYVRKRDTLAGTALGGMIVAKSAGLALPFLLVAERRWWALAGVGLMVALVVAGTSALLGTSAWLAYAMALAGIGTHTEIAVTAYQSVPGILAHLFRFDPLWNPRPIVDLPWLVAPLTALAAMALVGLTGWRSSRAQPIETSGVVAFAAWAILSIVLSPATSDYHYTLAILPTVLLLDRCWEHSGDRLSLVIVLVGIILMGAPWPQRIFATTDGLAALVAYPRLYGGLLLWSVAVGLMPSVRPSPRQPASSGQLPARRPGDPSRQARSTAC
jgi:hypothetical protein